MKDKLEKTGHRRGYFMFRRLALFGLLGVALLGVSTIPVGISYRMAEEAAAAQLTSAPKDEETSSSTSQDYRLELPL